MCRQSGEVPCPKCRNSGKMPCRNCAASGWHSTTYRMDVKAKGQFVYDRDALPPEVPPLIDELSQPDFAFIQSEVDAALVPYTPPPTDPAG